MELEETNETMPALQEKVRQCQLTEARIRAEQLEATASGGRDFPLVQAIREALRGQPQSEELAAQVQDAFAKKQAAEEQKKAEAQEVPDEPMAGDQSEGKTCEAGVRRPRDTEDEENAEFEAHWKNAGAAKLQELWEQTKGDYGKMAQELASEYKVRAKKAKVDLQERP